MTEGSTEGYHVTLSILGRHSDASHNKTLPFRNSQQSPDLKVVLCFHVDVFPESAILSILNRIPFVFGNDVARLHLIRATSSSSSSRSSVETLFHATRMTRQSPCTHLAFPFSIPRNSHLRRPRARSAHSCPTSLCWKSTDSSSPAHPIACSGGTSIASSSHCNTASSPALYGK